MTNLTTYSNNHNTHATTLDSFPSKKKTCKKAYLETSPTFSFMEVLFKKKGEREREGLTRWKNETPTPTASIRNNHHWKREGERVEIRQLETEE